MKNPDKMSERELRNDMKLARKVCQDQQEDSVIWIEAMTGQEQYLQSELRRLHKIIEGEIG